MSETEKEKTRAEKHKDRVEKYRKMAESADDVTIDLFKTFSAGGVKYSHVNLRRMTIGEGMRYHERSGSAIENDLWLISQLSEVPSKDLERMDPADFAVCQSVILEFWGPE